MSADADDLFERAARAEERAVPTLEELKVEFAQVLDEFETRYPDGRKPPRGQDTGLGFNLLLLKISNLRWALERGQYREFPREDDDVEQSAPDDASWDTFVASHPELIAAPTFTDDEILTALRSAIESRTQPWLQGARDSADVIAVLVPDATQVRNGRATPIVTSMGKRLARLAREGKVVRLRQKWTKGRGASIWSLPGITVNEWWLKQYEVDDA